MKPLRHPDDLKGQYKKLAKAEPELQPIHQAYEPKYIPGPEKFPDKDEQQALQSRKPSSTYIGSSCSNSLAIQSDFAKIPKPLHAVAKESIFGTGNIGLPQQPSERDRRLMLREIERKKRAAGASEAGSYGHLSVAGANIALQHESEVEAKTIRGSITEKCAQSPNAYFPHENIETGDSEKCKKEDYHMKYMQERKKTTKELPSSLPPVAIPVQSEETTPSESKKHSGESIEIHARFKKKDLDPETMEKRDKQRLSMQNELNKQIEEKQKRKLMEKQLEREAAEKEEQRIKKEQAELAAKHKKEEKNDYDKIKSRTGSKANPFAPSPVETNTTLMVQGYNSNSRVKLQKISPEPSIMTEPLAPPKVEHKVEQVERQEQPLPAIPQKILEDYQRQIESLRNEKQLAKEEALSYKEQLLKEREIQLQSIINRMQSVPSIPPIPQSSATSSVQLIQPSQSIPSVSPIPPIPQIPLLQPMQPILPIQPLQPIPSPLPYIVEHPNSIKGKSFGRLQPIVRPESKETCEETLESFSRRVPTRSSNEVGDETTNMTGELDILEQSLSSNTKLVTVSGNTTELYKTWKPLEIQQHLFAKAQALKECNSSNKKVSEVAIQTNSEPYEKLAQVPAARSPTKPEKKTTKGTETMDESKPFVDINEIILVEEDYAQASFESEESEEKTNKTEDNVLFGSRPEEKKKELAEEVTNKAASETSIALAKFKPKTINIFKKLDESREKTKRLQQKSSDSPFVAHSNSKAEGLPEEKPRPCTVSKKERYQAKDEVC